MKLVILITAQIENGLDVAQGWQQVGAPGVTLIRSHGLHTLQEQLKDGEVELPRMVVSMASALASIMDDADETTLIIMSVVPAEMVDRLIEHTSTVLGDLTSPNTGVMFVLDVERAVGVRDHRSTG